MTERLLVTPEQLKLMSHGPRREIIAALANDSDLSARDLADRLKRPVTGLYRHLDLLVEAGLLQQTGLRPGHKRPEALYALTFKIFSSDEAAKTPEGRVAIAEVAARYASAASRKIHRAVEEQTARIGVEDANTRTYVCDLQLDTAGVVELHKLLNAFLVEARKLRVPAEAARETVSMTVLIAPGP